MNPFPLNLVLLKEKVALRGEGRFQDKFRPYNRARATSDRGAVVDPG